MNPKAKTAVRKIENTNTDAHPTGLYIMVARERFQTINVPWRRYLNTKKAGSFAFAGNIVLSENQRDIRRKICWSGKILLFERRPLIVQLTCIDRGRPRGVAGQDGL